MDGRYFLLFTMVLKSSKLWSSPYSDYQLFLYDKIKSLLGNGWSYNRIAKHLNDNGYKTVRNRCFRSPHVHSIVKKKELRDERLEQLYDTVIQDVEIRVM
jgi:hypothetical protein